MTNLEKLLNYVVAGALTDYNEIQGDVAQANLIKMFSPVAWTHINFYARYDLLRNDSSITLIRSLDSYQQKPWK